MVEMQEQGPEELARYRSHVCEPLGEDRVEALGVLQRVLATARTCRRCKEFVEELSTDCVRDQRLELVCEDHLERRRDRVRAVERKVWKLVLSETLRDEFAHLEPLTVFAVQSLFVSVVLSEKLDHARQRRECLQRYHRETCFEK